VDPPKGGGFGVHQIDEAESAELLILQVVISNPPKVALR